MVPVFRSAVACLRARRRTKRRGAHAPHQDRLDLRACAHLLADRVELRQCAVGIVCALYPHRRRWCCRDGGLADHAEEIWARGEDGVSASLEIGRPDGTGAISIMRGR